MHAQEGYCSWVCVVCLFVCLSHLTSGASVYPENMLTYSADNEGQNSFGIFSETAPLQRSSTPSVESHTYGQPFFLVLMCIICTSTSVHSFGRQGLIQGGEWGG